MADWLLAWRSRPDPQNASLLPHDIYSQRLLSVGNGYALYEPDPKNMYDMVRVGDVGYITDGFFHRAFNVFRTAEDPINSQGVPEHFEPCKSSGTRPRTDLAVGSCLRFMFMQRLLEEACKHQPQGALNFSTLSN